MLSPSNSEALSALLADIRQVGERSPEAIPRLRAALEATRANVATLSAAALSADEAYLAGLSPTRRAIARAFEGNDIHRQAQRARGLAQR